MKKKRKPVPPKIPFFIIRGLSHSYHRLTALGDLQELYALYVKERGVRRAKRWYWKQALKSIPRLSCNLIYWSAVMFKNYMKMSWRNIIRNKGFSLINISGLTVGMSCCILIMIFLNNELSYDRFHEKSSRIYRANTISSIGVSRRIYPSVPAVFADGIKEAVPEIESFTRIIYGGSLNFQYRGKEVLLSDMIGVDPGFFQIFSYDFTAGDPKSALDSPGSLVITEELAQRIFGDKDPLEEAFYFTGPDQQALPCRVTGVIRNIPRNSQVRFGCVSPISSFQYLMGEDQTPAFLLDPYYCRLEAYFLVREGVDIKNLEKKIDDIARTKWEEIYKSRGTTREFFLLNIRDIHLKSPCELEHFPIGDIHNVYLFSVIAILVLMIACFNFINLSTARSADRATEVGIRKVIGSQKSQLIRQFLSESVIISIFSLSAAVLLVILVLPSFGSLVGVELHRGDALNFSVLAGILMIVIAAGLVAGSFPAFILSAFDPIKVLKGKMSGASKNSALRRILVVFQFSVSIFMIAGIITIIRQLDYLRTKDLGFYKDHMVVINSPGQQSDTLRRQIKNQSGVISVCFSMNVPGVFRAFRSYSASMEDPDAEGLRVFEFIVGYDFLETYGLEIIQGRDFSRNFSTDVENAIIINEKAADLLGWSPEEAVGKILYNTTENNTPGTVIGIVKNFHHTSLKESLSPAVLALNPEAHVLVSVRISPDDIPGTLARLESVFRDSVPNQEFHYYFIDDAFRQMYPEEERVGQIYLTFGILAIFVAGLGLFGLSSFVITQRTKEIGVRKVLGASNREIVLMLSSGFIRLVLLANLIAWPLAIILMQRWLGNFAYRISMTWDIPVISGIIALGIAVLTVSVQSVKVALANPADSLRYE